MTPYRIAQFFETFVNSQVFGGIAEGNHNHGYLMLRHVITMIKELSKAKENCFKSAQWPFELLKAPSSVPGDLLKFRIKALKVNK
jgi:hypothetical protein